MSFKRCCFTLCLPLLVSLYASAIEPALDPAFAVLLFNEGKFGEAAAILERTGAGGTLSFHEEVILGVCYIKTGQLKRARALLDELEERNSRDAFLSFACANLEFAAEDFRAAYEKFKQAGEAGYDSSVCKAGMTAALVNRGVMLFKDGNGKAARECFLQAYGIDKTASAVLKNLGLLELKEKNFKQAAFYLEQALEQDRENPELISLLLTAYKKDGNREALLKNLLALSTVLPSNGDVLAELGMVYEQSGNMQAAGTAFARAEEYGTEEPYVYHWLAARAGKKEEELYLVHQAIGKAIYRINAIRIEAAGKMEKSGESFTPEEVQEIKELSQEAEEPLGILDASLARLHKLFDSPAALESDLERLISWYPAGLELQTTLGKLYAETRQWGKAEKLWLSILKKNPASSVSQQGMGQCLEMTGRPAGAVIYYLRALDLAPAEEDHYTDLERVYTGLNRLSGLVDELRDRSLRDKRNPLLFERLSALESRLGLTEAAAAHKKRSEELKNE